MPTPILIDLSHHNAVKDLQFAVDAGIGAAIVKISQGVGGLDKAYPLHAEKVAEVGLRLGAYHFGTGVESGEAQADYFLRTLEAAGGIPQVLVLDVETNPGGTTMSRAQAEAFLESVRTEHPISTVMIYGGSLLREMHLPKNSPLLTAPLWLADYTPPPNTVPPWPNWMLWQFTDKGGIIPGMPDSLDGYDLSDAFDGEATLKHLWNEIP